MTASEERFSEDPAAGDIVQQHLENCDWSGGSTPFLSLRQSCLSRVRFSGRSIEKMQVLGSSFEQCLLDRCQCPGVWLQAGQWQECDCREMAAPNARFYHWKAQDSRFHNADFHGAYLNGVDFENCELAGSNWRQAILMNVRFETTNYLGRTDLRHSDFSCAVFMDVQLSEADFTGANLKNAVFLNANLENAVFTDADLENTIFLGCRR